MKYWPHVTEPRPQQRVWVPREMFAPVLTVALTCALAVGWGLGPLLFGVS